MGKTTSTTTKKVVEGLGLAAVAATAAATYFFYGANAKKYRKEFEVWSKNAKMEMIKKIKSMKTVSKQSYEAAAKEILAKYKMAKNITPQEAEALGKELKKHWEKIAADIKKLEKKPIAPKKPAKKPTKK